MNTFQQHEIYASELIEEAISSASSPVSITTKIITDADQFRDLRSEWNALLHACSCDCLFLTWEWAYSWWLHLAGKRKLHIITVRRNGRLIALAPLVLRPGSLRRFMPWRALEFLASGSVGSDYMSFLIRPQFEGISIREITASLARSGHMLDLVRIERSSPVMAELASRLRECGWALTGLTTNYSPYCTLKGHTWESLVDSIRTSDQMTLTRMMRRLHKDFEVKLLRVETESERGWAMDLMIEMHLKRWSEKGGSNALNKQELVDFHQAFSRISLAEGWLKLYTLMLDGVPAASLYVFKYGNVYYHYQSALNLDYSKYSVGKVILSLVIREAIEDGASEFDFLHDNEPYKYFWARQERELIRLECYPERKIVNLYKYALAVKHGIKRLAAKTPFQQHSDHDRAT